MNEFYNWFNLEDDDEVNIDEEDDDEDGENDDLNDDDPDDEGEDEVGLKYLTNENIDVSHCLNLYILFIY